MAGSVLFAATGVAAAIIVFIGFACLGSTTGRARLQAADPIVGWAIGTGAITAAGVLAPGLVGVSALAAAVAAVAAGLWAWRRGEVPGGPLLWLTVLLLLPFLLQAARAPTAEWDDFTHWLPNAAYLYRFDDFPRSGLPGSLSFWPAYPYALPLWHWMTSRLSGAFFEPAGAVANVLALGGFAAALVSLVRAELGQQERRLSVLSSFGWAAFGILLVTAANPSFVKSYHVTAYADSATAVAVAVLAVLGWQILERLREGEAASPAARAMAWQFGAVASLLVNLKQANLVLVPLILSGMALLVLRDRAIDRGQLLRLLLPMLLPMLALYLLWRHHVQTHMPGREFAFLPFDQWRWSMLDGILRGIWAIVAKKGGHYGLMMVVSGWAAFAWLRGPGRLERFLVIAATVFLGYSGFLLFTYLAASFSDDEVLRAASFWRYSTHAGLLGVTAAALSCARLWAGRRALGRVLAHPLMSAALLGAVVILPLAAPRLLVNYPGEAIRRAQIVGRELAEALPSDARVLVIAGRETALVGSLMVLELWRPGRDDRNLRVVRVVPAAEAASVDRTGVTHVLFFETDVRPAPYDSVAVPGWATLASAGVAGWQTQRTW
ncbi:MAG TPA: hypothetical protein VD978_02910 [Azospirillum sp.]|nr:hypothetical protein [Azospirillum sp.]